MVMGNDFSSREAVRPIKEIIWNEEPLMGFENLYVSFAAVYCAHSAASKCHLH
jgi:hypothetical protein